jgi:hypothetical protein
MLNKMILAAAAIVACASTLHARPVWQDNVLMRWGEHLTVRWNSNVGPEGGFRWDNGTEARWSSYIGPEGGFRLDNGTEARWNSNVGPEGGFRWNNGAEARWNSYRLGFDVSESDHLDLGIRPNVNPVVAASPPPDTTGTNIGGLIFLIVLYWIFGGRTFFGCLMWIILAPFVVWAAFMVFGIIGALLLGSH